MSLTNDEKSNLFGNTITFPHNFAIRGAVRKYANDFCLKKISFLCLCNFTMRLCPHLVF